MVKQLRSLVAVSSPATKAFQISIAISLTNHSRYNLYIVAANLYDLYDGFQKIAQIKLEALAGSDKYINFNLKHRQFA